MFSVPMRSTLAKLPSGIVLASALGPPRRVLPYPEPLASMLPDGGLPRGAVVEISSPAGLAASAHIALEACLAAQRESRLRGGESAWCAWLDPEATLNAPVLAYRGIDLDRLLIVRPPREKLARVAVRVAFSQVFSVVVVDTAGVPGARSHLPLDPWLRAARKLAIAVEKGDTAVLLLTDTRAERKAPLPTAMRIELERPGHDWLSVRIAKERSGRITPARIVAFPPKEEEPLLFYPEEPSRPPLASTRRAEGA